MGQLKHLAMPVEEYDPGPHSSEMVKTIRIFVLITTVYAIRLIILAESRPIYR